MSYAKNVGLAVFLIVSCGVAFSATTDLVNRIGFLLYAAASCVLVMNTARRGPADAEDDRLWVWGLCGISSVYYLAFEPGQVASMVIVLHVLGDLSLIYLGRSFAIVPARRTLRVGWLYRFVRHPAYATYIITDGLFIATSPSAQNVAVATVGLGLFLVRIRLEEQLLGADPAYGEYCQRTRHRLIPGLY